MQIKRLLKHLVIRFKMWRLTQQYDSYVINGLDYKKRYEELAEELKNS
jgi:hypothetical protein